MEEQKCEDLNYEADTGEDYTDRLADFVRRRAYQLFVERGGQPGHEVEDWLRAEREIKHHWGMT